MENSNRLNYISAPSRDQLHELWMHCGYDIADRDDMNKDAPYAVPNEAALTGFLANSGKGYNSWLIQENHSENIIGFMIHGNFFGGLPNSIGFLVARRFAGNGYATEGLKSLLEHLNSTGLKETFGYCLDSNLASMKVMEKCGFVNKGNIGVVFNGMETLKFKKSLR